jgi:hypothetical protein
MRFSYETTPDPRFRHESVYRWACSEAGATVECADLAYGPTSLCDMSMPRVYSSARDKILDATERVILRDGPHGVSVKRDSSAWLPCHSPHRQSTNRCSLPNLPVAEAQAGVPR